MAKTPHTTPAPGRDDAGAMRDAISHFDAGDLAALFDAFQRAACAFESIANQPRAEGVEHFLDDHIDKCDRWQEAIVEALQARAETSLERMRVMVERAFQVGEDPDEIVAVAVRERARLAEGGTS